MDNFNGIFRNRRHYNVRMGRIVLQLHCFCYLYTAR